MCSCLGPIPPEIWDIVVSYLGRKSLMSVAHCRLCYGQIVRTQVNSRITHHFSSQAPYKLRIIFSDPTTMERCESLELELSESQLPPGISYAKIRAKIGGLQTGKISSGQIYTVLDIPRGQDTRNQGGGVSLASSEISRVGSQTGYTRYIQLDDLDFLYQLHFDLHKCRPLSPIAVNNLCGERVQLLRLWKRWFTADKDATQSPDGSSPMKLFTRIVWADASRNVGLTVSAYTPQKDDPGMASLVQGEAYKPKIYRLEFESIIISHTYLLGVFEGFNV